MTKLNYTNRKIDGLKLGQVIAKDLLKRIPPGAASKAALRDPCVELDVSGRVLADHGCKEAATALVASVKYSGDNGKVVRLEELCLKGNHLTSSSLIPLSRVVASAARELRDIDLSDNVISVGTDEETTAWEEFLLAFSKCCVLRRIDFSGNPLGSRAFEVLARVYGKEDPLDLHSPFDSHVAYDDIHEATTSPTDVVDVMSNAIRKISLVSESEGYVTDIDDTTNVVFSGLKSSRQDAKLHDRVPFEKHNDLFHVYATTQGLRSVPYFILSNTAMTETCALHLSYIISNHQLPEELLSHVPPVKAGTSAQQLDIYNTFSRCRGVIYLPNPSLNSAAMKVLELSELARGGFIDGSPREYQTEDIKTPLKPMNTARRASEARLTPSPYAASGRRRSATSTGSSEQISNGSNGVTSSELDRARSRIQGNTLRDAGVHSNDLWSAALKMLALSRPLLQARSANLRRSIDNNWHEVKWQDVHRPTSDTAPPSLPLGIVNPNQTVLPKIFQRRKDVDPPSSLYITSAPALARGLNTLVSPLTAVRKEMLVRAGCSGTLVGSLSEEVWRHILALAAGAVGVVSEAQQISILRWAKDRVTLQRERENLGKPESAQIWKVLEGMGCLAYEMRN